MHGTDVVIAGAGVIGMSLAVELRRRGRRVTLLERATPGAGASNAAAGMLAAHDRANPPALQPLASLSEELYPAFLARLRRLAPAVPVPLQTEWTLESAPLGEAHTLPTGVATGAGPFQLMREASLDPRQLVKALLAACRQSTVRLMTGTQLRSCEPGRAASLLVHTGAETITCSQLVDTTGAWSTAAVRPVKGQMLRVHLGDATPRLPGLGNIVLRTPSIYLLPRLDGSAVIGATLEEKGFCIKTKDSTIADLRARAAALLPAVADALELERWAGLRPATTDGLPLLGPLPGSAPGSVFLATGHFRNGILLAPATAHVMAQLLCGETPGVSLQNFSPARYPSA